MIDLETLIRDKQDALRGRPRDWIDDFKDWRIGVDLTSVIFCLCCITITVCDVIMVAALLSQTNP